MEHIVQPLSITNLCLSAQQDISESYAQTNILMRLMRHIIVKDHLR